MNYRVDQRVNVNFSFSWFSFADRSCVCSCLHFQQGEVIIDKELCLNIITKSCICKPCN